jgi:hypothetical protein
MRIQKGFSLHGEKPFYMCDKSPLRDRRMRTLIEKPPTGTIPVGGFSIKKMLPRGAAFRQTKR